MAKKKQVPIPPGPVQAPKRRSEPRDPRRTRIWLAAAAAAVVVVAGAAIGIALAVGGGDEEGAASGSGVCTRETFPSMGKNHVLELKKGFKYNSFPATSGPHHPQPAIWNAYDRPVPEIHLVHNLEHGGVVVQYGKGVPQATVAEIIGWYRDDPSGIVVAPLPELRSKIALTAWTELANCSRFDEGEFSDFRDDFRFKGPEAIPPGALQPGT